MTREQKKEINGLFSDVKGSGELDYVSGWYKKAVSFIAGTTIHVAFVSTNSICQGQQVVILWKSLFNAGIHINFAYRTFQWDSESTQKAHVHCIIVGFSLENKSVKYLFDNETKQEVTKINPYLTTADNLFIDNQSFPLCNVPPMRFGSMPRDGGNLVLTEEEKDKLETECPNARKWIRPYIGSEEFINRKTRWCLWLVGAAPDDIHQSPIIQKKVANVREFRLASKAEATRKFASTPTLFCQIAQPDTPYICVPSVSSEKRQYIPMGFMQPHVIISNAAFLIPNATLYHFGVLTSSVHMAWMRTVCGRLEMRYRYSKDIVYNNFPWANPTVEQKTKIEETAQAILDARALYPNSSFAMLYDPVTMPPELLKAHQKNDQAVLRAYGFKKNISESDIVAKLMKMYQKLTLK